MADILQLTDLSKSFGALRILEKINLVIGEGKSVAIVGPSGTGKSTLLHLAGLMEKPTHGTVSLNGYPTAAMSENERAMERLNTIGFLFQFHHLLADFTLLENVLLPARLAKDSIKEAQSRAKELLNRLNIIDRQNHYPHQLSGGEQQRAAFARAILRRPKLLLCDEPTGNLDEHTADEMIALMWDEIKAQNLAVVIVTHNNSLAEKTDVTYRLSEGYLWNKQGKRI